MNGNGGCMCGEVRFEAQKEPLRVTVCHCVWCQRRTGSAFGVEVVFAVESIAMSGTTIVKHRHYSDESGRWLDVEFCGKCGTNLGFTLEAVPGIRTLPAGAFDDPSWITSDRHPFRHVFTRSRREWSEIGPHVDAYEAHFRK
jgi:hypothetical protein